MSVQQTEPHRRESGSGTARFPFSITSSSLIGLITKIIGLGLVGSLAIAVTPTLIATQNWALVVVIWLIVIAAFAIYLTGRAVPAKYLFPGALMLVLFLIYPIVLTLQLSMTNYGDGTRGSKEAAISRIVGSSAVLVDGGAAYTMVVGTPGSITTGPFTLFLVDVDSGQAFAGTEEELTPLAADEVTISDGVVTEVPGYQLLTRQEQNDISGSGGALDGFSVPVGDGSVVRIQGFQAVSMSTPLVYDEETDSITNTDTGVVYTVQRAESGDRSYFVDDAGNRLSSQSWGENVGLANFEKIFTDTRITADFFGIFLWTLVFAFLSVASTFLLGLVLAVTLNEPRMRFQRLYRSLLILPYAIPGFISLLVWSGFWNRDFGLINEMLGLSVNWLGETTAARAAVLLTNLWLGFPYMFLICTGALQSIPSELKEAASIDGANGFTQFRTITFPLLMVSVAPLLVSSFAFNFNNFNAIQLLTQGGPFSSANPNAGGTDILISYTYRLAFGTSGQQIGFASAISVVLFVLTAVIAAIQFRGTRALEDVN